MLQLGRLPVRVTVLAVAILATAAGGSWFAMNHDRASGSAAAGRHGSSGQATQAAAVPLQVVSVTPARHTQHVNGAAPVTIQFSAPLAPDSPAPEITPGDQLFDEESSHDGLASTWIVREEESEWLPR